MGETGSRTYAERGDTGGLLDRHDPSARQRRSAFPIEQTAAWGEGDRRYAVLNRHPLRVGLVLVIVAAMILDVSARETGAAVMAVAPFLAGRIQRPRARSTRRASRVAGTPHIQAVLDPERPSSDVDVRTAQDELYRPPMASRRIPTWLYNRYAERDRAAIDGAITARIEGFRAEILTSRTPTVRQLARGHAMRKSSDGQTTCQHSRDKRVKTAL